MGYDTVWIVNFFKLFRHWRQSQQEAPQRRIKNHQSARRHIPEELTVQKLSILKIYRQINYSGFNDLLLNYGQASVLLTE